MKRLVLAAAVVLGLLAPVSANASSINFNCGTCGSHNTSFDVTYSLVNAATNTYDLTIVATYQPAGAGVPDFVYLNALAFKFSTLSYDSTPAFVSGPAEDTWSLVTGGLSSGGCNGNGAGFYCFSSVGYGATRGGAGSTDTWKARLDLTGLIPPGGTLPLTLKAQFTNASGSKVGSLISDDGTATLTCNGGSCQPPQPVPEPASLALLGSGLVLVAARLRRARRN